MSNIEIHIFLINTDNYSMNSNARTPIIVYVDPELRELADNYLKNKIRELDMIQKCIDATDAQALKVFGHKTKGTAGSYGLDTLGKLAGEIEAHALANDFKLIAEKFSAVKIYLLSVQLETA